eukprot:1147886-Pelagomonas_calceolata.AAC.5
MAYQFFPQARKASACWVYHAGCKPERGKRTSWSFLEDCVLAGVNSLQMLVKTPLFPPPTLANAYVPATYNSTLQAARFESIHESYPALVQGLEGLQEKPSVKTHDCQC